ncbi:MAG: LacI family transcriptional regulator [Actinobacteria bacterium]|nr:LacI family transcriptional regulator [Actinomycetota bacterium]
MKVNIKDVAKKAGVSTATVTRVLSSTSNVRGKTRQKVLDAAKELNYEVNFIARSLKQKRSNTIGIVVGKVFSRFYSTIVKSIEDVASKNGYNIILCDSNDDPEKELKNLKILNSLRVDGILLIPSGKNADYINNLLKTGTKIVLIDRLIPGIICDSVLVNDEKGAYLATNHLISKGYKNIGLINGPLDITTGQDRLNGYLKALKEAGLKKMDNLIKLGKFDKASGINLSKELLESASNLDAIFATNLDLTLGTLITIKNKNIKIPDDVALVGFDDSDWTTLIEPQLTVITYPIQNFGSTAAEILIKKISNAHENDESEPISMILDTSIIIRNST